MRMDRRFLAAGLGRSTEAHPVSSSAWFRPDELDELSIYESAIDGNQRPPSAIAEMVKAMLKFFYPCAMIHQCGSWTGGTTGQDNEAKNGRWFLPIGRVAGGAVDVTSQFAEDGHNTH